MVVVDDADLSRRSVVEILETSGYSVVGQAKSAEEAVQISSTSGANLFIIDVVMPDVSGIELAKLLSDKINNVSIIMMSSLGMEHIVIESISNGAIDFLHKPFDAKTLLKAVGKISQQNLNEG